MGHKPSKPKAVVPKVIPVQDTSVVDATRKKAEAVRQKQGGVASTVLSDVLGG